MKKLFITLAIAIGFMMQAVAYDFQSGNLLYSVVSTDPPCVSLVGHIDGQAAQGELIIPESVTNEGVAYTVTRIANSAFFSCTRLSGELVIPDAVTIIGNKAFYDCYGITSVTFGNALEEIREHAFYKCLGLQQISAFPESLTEIGEEAFGTCTSLTGTIVIPPQMTTIKEYAFSCCGITSVVFPDGLTTIEQYAFLSTPLTSLHIPASLTSIGTYAFDDTRLESITVDEANPVYDSRNNCNALIETATNTLMTGCFNTVFPHSLVAIGNGAFINCDRLKSITIPEGVTKIEDNAFWDCDSLATVVLPASLNSIGKKAFLCYGITSIVSKSYTPPTAVLDSYDFTNNSFGGMSHNIPIHIPFGTTEAYRNAEGWNYFSNFIEEEPIIYTDYESDPYLHATQASGEMSFDLNYDSIPDFRMHYALSSGGSWFDITVNQSNMSLCLSSENDTIALADDWRNGFYSSTPFDWELLGFRVEIEGDYYYGWFRIYYVQGEWNWYFDKMAYCTIPNYPLRWGQTSLDDNIGEECAEWYYEIQNDDGSITYQHLECVGDTLFEGGKRPKIIIRSNTQYDKDLHTEVTHEYIYEENGKVYWWNKQLQQFTTLYNYAAETGDEWEILVGTERLTMHVDTVETVEHEGNTYTMLRVSDPNDLFSGDIVCGIGHLTSFFPERLMTRGKGYRIDGMRCYWVDGELTFKLGDEDCDEIYLQLHNGIEEDDLSTGSGALVLYPNPANNTLFVQTLCATSLPDQTYRITNLMGQTMLQGNINAENQQIDISTLPTGMYFITVGEATRKFTVR